MIQRIANFATISTRLWDPRAKSWSLRPELRFPQWCNRASYARTWGYQISEQALYMTTAPKRRALDLALSYRCCLCPHLGAAA